MFNVASYLEKFKKMEPDGDTEKRAVQKALLEKTGISVEKSTMRISGGVVYLNISGILKNEVYMNKNSVLVAIYNTLGDKRIKDIR